MLTAKEIRQKYIDFYISKGHTQIPSASIIPENDPSTLFTTAGMQPLVPFLMGEKHPSGKRLVNSQKCIRTGDIDEVGDKTHHTFFEMLGHWSLGDYFKQEAIQFSFEFLTQALNIPLNRLAFSIFAGDETATKDEEAASAWQNLGVAPERIAYLPKKENWWEPVGESGPCGPDTEMFYWADENNQPPQKFDPQDSRWVEIGNDVLMQYQKAGEGKYIPAEQKNIDNGTGLERLTGVLNGFDDNYHTDLFWPLIEKIQELSDKKYLAEDNETTKSMRIIADHIRATTFIMADDAAIEPSNTDQGYVVRKLIRRAICHGRTIGIQENFTPQIAKLVIENMQDDYAELKKNQSFVLEKTIEEEEKFTRTLQQGIKQFNKVVEKVKSENKHQISGEEAFDLFQTYGFPFELTKEMAGEEKLEVNEAGFKKAFESHQQLSRTATAGKFKGGLANASKKAIQYHTATHLLNAALRQVLGEHIYQKGSNINDERMRFDFSHPDKITPEQKQQVEDLVNTWIKADLPVECHEMEYSKAKQTNAIGFFDNKYGEKVRVFVVGDESSPTSKEICGGPHVKKTGELGKFKIKKEESSSAGVRRIKAVLV